MPGMDGVALAEAITSEPAFQPITLIALSSVDGLFEETGSRARLFHTWVRKPIRQSLLKNCLTRIRAGIPLTARGEVDPEAIPLKTQILLTEDNPVNHEVTIGMVDLLQCALTLAANGREAVEAAAQTAFDLILMDCQMPEMDGFTATTTICRQETDGGTRRHVPIIALTANAMEGDRARCLAAGMDDYLAKPFTLTQLKAVLTRWLTLDPVPMRPSDLPTAAVPDPPADALSQTISAGVDRSAWAAIQAVQRPDHPDLLTRVLATYLEDSRRQVEQIRSAIQSQDPVTLHQATHRLKSSSAQLGAFATATHCKDLETLGRLAQLERAAELLAQLTQAHDAACTVMAQELMACTAQ